jgi:hypothetical protein
MSTRDADSERLKKKLDEMVAHIFRSWHSERGAANLRLDASFSRALDGGPRAEANADVESAVIADRLAAWILRLLKRTMSGPAWAALRRSLAQWTGAIRRIPEILIRRDT